MSTPISEMSERHAAVLARLTELGLSLAERVHAEAMVAEGTEALETLSAAFHRVSRSVRMSMALEAKLAREARAAEQVAADVEERAARPPRHIENIIVHPVGDPETEIYYPIGWTESEAEAWAVNSRHPDFTGAKHPAVDEDLARPDGGVFAVRVRRLVKELTAVHGEAFAEAHAEARAIREIVAESAARIRSNRATGADSS